MGHVNLHVGVRPVLGHRCQELLRRIPDLKEADVATENARFEPIKQDQNAVTHGHLLGDIHASPQQERKLAPDVHIHVHVYLHVCQPHALVSCMSLNGIVAHPTLRRGQCKPIHNFNPIVHYNTDNAYCHA